MTPTDKDYQLIPMEEITDEARKIAVQWVENYRPMGMDIENKHKLASDIMNYAKIRISILDESCFQGSEDKKSEIFEKHLKGYGWEQMAKQCKADCIKAMEEYSILCQTELLRQIKLLVK